MMMSIPQAKKVLEALCASGVHEGDYDFGPAYEAARERHEEAKTIVRNYIRDANTLLVVWPNTLEATPQKAIALAVIEGVKK